MPHKGSNVPMESQVSCETHLFDHLAAEVADFPGGQVTVVAAS